jgi:nitroreductase
VELDEVIRQRRMCRSFLDRPVRPEIIDRLLERARRAPSAGHAQGWAWLVLEGSDQTQRFWAIDAEPAWLARPSHPGLLRAPVILVPLGNPTAYERRYAEADKAALGRPGGRRPPPPGEARHDGSLDGVRPFEGADRLTLPPGGRPVDHPVPWWDVDLSFAVMTVLLGAVDEGLGALFFALHGDPAGLRREFGVPAEWRPLGAVALGWPAADNLPSPSAGRGRRPWGEVVHRAHW